MRIVAPILKAGAVIVTCASLSSPVESVVPTPVTVNESFLPSNQQPAILPDEIELPKLEVLEELSYE